jgi:electron transfer flavoprotein alpha subunit
MTVLVIAEHDNAELNDATRAAVTAASKIGGDIHVLVAGKGASAVADAAAKLDGVSKVLHADSDTLEKKLAEAMEAVVVSIAGITTPFCPGDDRG